MLDAGVDGSNLLIGSSMTICDDSSGDNSADTNVEELEPTIQNLELDQKFNDAQSYLIDQIESGEISSDGGGLQRFCFSFAFSKPLLTTNYNFHSLIYTIYFVNSLLSRSRKKRLMQLLEMYLSQWPSLIQQKMLR